MLSLSLCYRQEMQLVAGGWTTIFPHAEALLEQTDMQLSLQFVAGRKQMDRYWTVMDFLFCELFLEFQGHCKRYYEDRGPALREILNVEQIADYDRQLVHALNVAVEWMKQKREKSWTQFRCDVIQP